jgi:putative ABC transport system ATP-binding protein
LGSELKGQIVSDPLIVCENLVKIYQLAGVEIMALQGLDLVVQPGEIVGLVGASGSGKSTLLNVLGGLDRPSAGRVQVGGRDLLKMSDRELDEYRRQQVGFIWQQTTRNLIPYLTALNNVELPLQLSGKSRGERRDRATQLLEVLGLGDRMSFLPAQLSGGEQQRVAMAVALANQPLILLADEPTGEVDTVTAAEVYAALRKINALYGMTTLIVSHDPNLSQHSDRVVAIRDGKTSTETVRYTRRAAITNPDEFGDHIQADNNGNEAASTIVPNTDASDAHPDEAPVEFEELVVLDKAGRLQLPREYLESLNIGDRVRLELTAGSISIYPVSGRGRAAKEPQEQLEDLVELYMEEDSAPEAGGLTLKNRLRSLSQRVLSRRDNSHQS